VAQVIEEHRGWVEEIQDPGFYCQCGRGFSEVNSYGVGEGDPCDLCGAPLVRLIRVERRVHPAYVVVRCACGAKVRCEGFTNTCDRCGADYNWNGDRLVDRRFWGEETGETAFDVLSTDHCYGDDEL
jgi:hypothetical protein